MRLLLFLFLILTIAETGFAQQPDTTLQSVTWSAGSFYDFNSSEQITRDAQVTVHNQTIDLTEGDNVLSFAITSSDGSWSDFTHDGIVTYHVTYQTSLSGTIKIERVSGVTKIGFDFSANSQGALHRDYAASGFLIN